VRSEQFDVADKERGVGYGDGLFSARSGVEGRKGAGGMRKHVCRKRVVLDDARSGSVGVMRGTREGAQKKGRRVGVWSRQEKQVVARDGSVACRRDAGVRPLCVGASVDGWRHSVESDDR